MRTSFHLELTVEAYTSKYTELGLSEKALKIGSTHVRNMLIKLCKLAMCTVTKVNIYSYFLSKAHMAFYKNPD